MRWRGGEGRVGRNFGFLRTVFRQRVRIVPPKHRRVTGIPVGFRTCIRSFATISVRSALPLALLPRSVLVHQLRVANGRQSGPRQMQFCNRFVANIYYLTPFSEANGKKVSRKEQLKSRCRTIPIFIGIQLGPLSERDSKSPTLELCDKGLARIHQMVARTSERRSSGQWYYPSRAINVFFAIQHGFTMPGIRLTVWPARVSFTGRLNVFLKSFSPHVGSALSIFLRLFHLLFRIWGSLW